MVPAEWWRELYAIQHEVWPEWSRSDGGAPAKVEFVLSWLGSSKPGRILDLGCGIGREVVELARRGFDAVGVDVSDALVARARELARQCEVSASFVQADFRTVELDGRFDTILMLDSAANIFDASEAFALWRRLRGLLSPGGWLVIEQLHGPFWDRSHPELRMESPKIGPGHTTRRYCYDRQTRRLFDETTYHPPGGPPRALPRQVLHLYGPDELHEMLGRAGYASVSTVGSDGWAWRHPADPPSATSASCMVRAQRA